MDLKLDNLDSQLNVIVGPNARGKTSVLEAISLITHWQSFRTNRSQELIQEGKNELSVTAEILNPVRCRVVFGVNKDKRLVTMDGKSVGSKSKYDFLGGSVTFCPDDLLMIKSGPDLRRDFLNQLGWSLDSQYSKTLQNFERVLKQRNKLLKAIRDGRFSFEEYSIWTEKFVEAAVPLYEQRLQLTKTLNRILPQIYKSLFNTPNEEVSVVYDYSLSEHSSISEALYQKINQLGEAERAVGYSLVGPQRDDILIKLNGLEAKTYASQGQIRGIVIALKIAQLELTKSYRSWQPVLLLDDIISELDETRTEALMSYLSSYAGQMFLTTPEASKVKHFQERFSGFKTIDLTTLKTTERSSELPLDSLLSA